MAEIEPFLIPLERAGFRVSWIGRIPNVETNVDRESAIKNLRPYHLDAVKALGGDVERFWLCEQVHGNFVAPVAGETNSEPVRDADGLISNDPECTLGVFVADCGAIYIGDPVKQVVSVVHSGRVGTEKNILDSAITRFRDDYGSDPADLIVSLAPCIRPPAYEVDFAASIRAQALACGILPENYHDCEVCTSSNTELYYSYRMEQGKTGRMLALIALNQ